MIINVVTIISFEKGLTSEGYKFTLCLYLCMFIVSVMKP